MTLMIGLLGSPREDGNTDILLDEALRCAAEAGARTEKIRVCDLDISGCTECEDCYATGECTIEDQMSVVYDALERADRILVASPIFFMALPAQMKAVIDRTQCYWALKYMLEEPFPARGEDERTGAFIGVGATQGERLYDGTILSLKYFFDAIGAVTSADDYVLVRGVDAKGEVRDREGAIDAACELGRALATSS